jgi:hypothetical protein
VTPVLVTCLVDRPNRSRNVGLAGPAAEAIEELLSAPGLPADTGMRITAANVVIDLYRRGRAGGDDG